MPLMGTDKSYNPTSFRRGYGNYEKDDEVYGFNGSLLNAGERLFDELILVPWKRDNLCDLYPSHSPYQYALNNPIYYIDIDGDYIKPGDQDSRAALEKHWSNIFQTKNGNSVVVSIFRNSYNGTYYTGLMLDEQAFRKALRGNKLSRSQKALARGYYKAIASADELYFKTLKPDEVINANVFKDADNKIKYGDQVAKDVLEIHGGGATTVEEEDGRSRSVTLVVEELGTAELLTVGEEKQGQGTGKSSFDELIGHELLGHGLGEAAFKFIRIESAKFAIKISNLVRKVEGKTTFRNGADHEGNLGIIQEGKQTEIPQQLEE